MTENLTGRIAWNNQKMADGSLSAALLSPKGSSAHPYLFSSAPLDPTRWPASRHMPRASAPLIPFLEKVKDLVPGLWSTELLVLEQAHQDSITASHMHLPWVSCVCNIILQLPRGMDFTISVFFLLLLSYSHL